MQGLDARALPADAMSSRLGYSMTGLILTAS